MSEDEIYNEAIKYLKRTGNATVAHFQQRFRISYVAAEKLLGKLEEDGIVSQRINGKRTYIGGKKK